MHQLRVPVLDLYGLSLQRVTHRKFFCLRRCLGHGSSRKRQKEEDEEEENGDEDDDDNDDNDDSEEERNLADQGATVETEKSSLTNRWSSVAHGI